jgi:carbamoyltransferase
MAMPDKASTLFVGANFVSHDASVFGICDGEIFAISEERFTRFKHDAMWPLKSLLALRDHFVCQGKTIDRVICGVPMKSFENQISIDNPAHHYFMRKIIGGRYLKDFVTREHDLWRGSGRWLLLLRALVRGTISLPELYQWMKARLFKKPLKSWVLKYLKETFGNIDIAIRFFDHHECHALSAFGVCGFSESLVITMDGWGDGAFTKVYRGDDDGVKLLSQSDAIKIDSSEYDLPNEVRRTGIFEELSVGHAYSIITWLLGFTPGADEGKVEALAAYGSPDDTLLSRFHSAVHVETDRIVIDKDRFLAVFHYPASHEQLRALPRELVSATIQRFLEEIYLDLIKKVTDRYQLRNVCLAGGVAANVILNMKMFYDLGLNIFVVPAMADDGISMGAAFAVALKQTSQADLRALDASTNGMPYYGTAYDSGQTLAALESQHGLPLQWEWVGETWPERCAQRICELQEIGAIFHGRCEYGPRALGNRSIVADLRNSENTRRINLLVKNRPGFQPFCPSILDEELDRLFDKAYLNKHMTCAFRMRKEHVDAIPCAVHIDHTARVQFVTKDSNPDFYRMLREIKHLSGYGGVLNTSFNKHGRTICESPVDALTDFVDCNIDFLMLNGYLVTRVDNPLINP